MFGHRRLIEAAVPGPVEHQAIGHCHRNRLTVETWLRQARWMSKISCARHHRPPPVIRQTAWLYLRFSLRLRDVEDLLAERGLELI